MQYLFWFVCIYIVLIIWTTRASKDTVYFLLPLGLMVLITLALLCYWIFGAQYAVYWLSVIGVDFLILLGVMGMEKSAAKVGGASGWATFGWLMLHVQLALLLLFGKAVWWVWQYFMG